ncbi:MAG: choice-of-anchor L domain-containing protein [Acidimicrobiales bacterium]
MTLDLRFLSEEFPEFVGQSVNDAFIAEVDNSTWTTSGSTITAPDNFAFDPTGEVISINSSGATSMSADEAAGTTYDGATPLLSASTAVTAGAHHLYLSIFDQGDTIYDSAVFVDGLGLGFVPNPATQCKPGATPFNMTLTPASATNPVGTTHTVTATLTQGGDPLPAKPVKFSVTGVNPRTGTGTTNSNGIATFTYTGAKAGTDTIVACFDETNDGSCEATASATKTWQTGTTNTPTSCVVTAVRQGPPAQQDVTVRDLDGIASITNVNVINGTVAVPAFTAGVKTPIVLTATKTDQTKKTFWEFDVTDSKGVKKHCV